MADLGAIAKTIPGFALKGVSKLVQPLYADAAVPLGTLQASLRMDGTFAGNVKTSGVNEPYVDVFVLWRPTMRVIAHTRTDVDGNWELSGFDPTRASNYAVVYKDPATGTAFNDAIYSLAVPA